MFLGLRCVPRDPFPKDLWGKKICALVVGTTGRSRGGEGGQRRPGGAAEADHRLGPPMPFPALQRLFDPLLPKGLQWYWKADFVKDLPDAAIEAHVAQLQAADPAFDYAPLPDRRRGPQQDKDATAWSCSDATWSMVIGGVDPDPQGAGAQGLGQGILGGRPSAQSRGRLLNFMMDDEATRIQGRLSATITTASRP